MASSNGLTAVFVTWMEPAVFFREHRHNCSTVTAITCAVPAVVLRFLFALPLCIFVLQGLQFHMLWMLAVRQGVVL